jgi:putative DNA primase/helicase
MSKSVNATVKAGAGGSTSIPSSTSTPTDRVILNGRFTKGVVIGIKNGDNTKRTRAQGMAEILLRELHFAKDTGRALYLYKDGVYQPSDGDDFVKNIIIEYLTDQGDADKIATSLLNESVSLLKTIAPFLYEIPPTRYINLRNGIYDVDTGELIPHTPSLLSTVQLPIEYNPTATCPTWDKFISEVFHPDSQITPYELVAWLMTPCTDIKKLVLLLGRGNNGKSIFLHALQSFLGPTNYSTLNLHKILGDKFAAAGLVGKLANICGEISNKHLPSTDKLKELTGGDRVNGERKYGDNFTFLPFARHIYSANKLPEVKGDDSDGYYDRWFIVKFPNRFDEVPGIAHSLKVSLSNPRELAGVFNKALKLLPKVLTEGLTKTRSMQESLEEYRKLHSNVHHFLTERVLVVEGEKNWVVCEHLYKQYLNFCDEKHEWPKDIRQFGKELLTWNPTVYAMRKKIKGQVNRTYQNVILIKDARKV